MRFCQIVYKLNDMVEIKKSHVGRSFGGMLFWLNCFVQNGRMKGVERDTMDRFEFTDEELSRRRQ